MACSFQKLSMLNNPMRDLPQTKDLFVEQVVQFVHGLETLFS